MANNVPQSYLLLGKHYIVLVIPSVLNAASACLVLKTQDVVWQSVRHLGTPQLYLKVSVDGEVEIRTSSRKSSSPAWEEGLPL